MASLTATCSACATAVPPGARFCLECGTPVAHRCPSCGQGVGPAQRFCGDCGTALSSEGEGAADVGAVLPERRLVTVLFADLVGFTTLSEHRDPEAVRDMLEGYFERCRTVIGRHGGVVEKFIGDAVMAVWGTPVAREDDAERAVRAALELVAAVPALGAAAGFDGLQVRAGLLTGETAVNVGAEHEGMVIGDAVNTASRIQSLAAPGTVLVEDATRRATDRAIAFEPHGTHAVKGRARPVRTWIARRVTDVVGGGETGGGLEAPLAGRAAELTALTGALERVMGGGGAERVTVVGDAGLGKTRLAWELRKHVDGLVEDVLWHRGRCPAYGEGVAFWALLEVVRTRAGIQDGDPADAARAKLRATVERYVADERERRLVTPRLEHLLGLGDGSAELGDLFSGWRLFLERLTDHGPVVLVMEDLQWADSGLLDFLDHLLEWSARAPLLVVALARPELLERRPGWAAGTHHLGPLDAGAMRELLGGLVPGLPGGSLAGVAERAEGVPLYAVETVRMLLDREVLRRHGDVYIVDGDIDAVAVPETMQALVAARLDALDAPDRRLLQDAAVLGTSFAAADLVAITTVADPEASLRRLIDRALLDTERDPRSPEHGHHRFTSALLRNVAYGRLGRRERKARHLAVAERLRDAWTAGGGDHAELLATHYAEAVRAHPDAPDAAALRELAAETLRDAGERALSLGATAEAREWFQQAAASAGDPRQRAELHGRAATAAVRGFDADALDVVRAAARRWDALGSVREAALLRPLEARILYQHQRLEEALAVAHDALDSLDGELDEGSARLALEVAAMAQHTGDFDLALEQTDRVLAYAERTGDPSLQVTVLTRRGCVLGFVERPEEGLALLSHALAIAQAIGPGPVIEVVLRSAHALLRCGRMEALLKLLAATTEDVERLGDRVDLAALRMNRFSAQLELGLWDEALDGIAPELHGHVRPETLSMSVIVHAARGDEEALDVAAAELPESLDSEDYEVRLEALAALARIALHRGEPELWLDRLVDGADESARTGTDLNPIRALLEVAIGAGRPEAAEPLVQRLEALGGNYACDDLRGHFAAFRGRAARLAGDDERADELLAAAADHFRACGARWPLARALADRRDDDVAQAEGHALLTELGALTHVVAP